MQLNANRQFNGLLTYFLTQAKPALNANWQLNWLLTYFFNKLTLD